MTRYANFWELHQRHTIEMLGLLKVIGGRGIRLDQTKLANFNDDLDNEMGATLDALNADPKIQAIRKWKIRKRLPMVDAPCSCFGSGVEGEKILKNGKTKSIKCRYCNGKGKLRVFEPEGFELREGGWGQPIDFVPSSPQVIAYMRAQGHKVPMRDGKPTTDAKQLALMWRRYKDDNYRLFVEYRKLQKMRGTYGEWPRQTRPGGVYVTTRFTLKPDTGRLSSVAPNVQNIPKDGIWAHRFKECLIASPGHKLVRADLSSAEALVTGWLAGDPDYMRLAKLGIHKFAMAKFLGEPVSMAMTDAELVPILNAVKKRSERLYRQIKVVVYGSNYLAGPRKIFENNPEDFESQAEAAKFQKFIKALSPKIPGWQARTVAQATRNKELVNPFGYRKAFWDLPGSDGPAAVAFLPQSIVAAVMKECMLALRWMTSGQWMVWQIHDELVFDVPEAMVDVCVEEVQNVLGQEWPELGGLRFGCEVKVGNSLAD